MKDALKSILVLINHTLQELNYLTEDQDRLEYFINSLGWESDVIPPSAFNDALDISDDIETIKILIDQLENQDSDPFALIEQAIPLVTSLLEKIKNFTNITAGSYSLFPLNQSAFWNELANNLFDTIFISYLQRDYKVIYSILYFFGVIHIEEIIPTENRRIPYEKKKFIWSNLGQLLTNPQQRFKTKYNWTSNGIMYTELFLNLLHIFNLLKLESRIKTLSEEVYSNFISDLSLQANHNLKELNVNITENLSSTNDYTKLGFIVAPGSNNGVVDGVIFVPEIIGLINLFFQPTPNSLIELEGYFNSNNIIGFKFFTNGKCQLLFSGDSNLIIGSKFKYAYAPSYPELLFGNASSNAKLFLNGYELSVEVKGELSDPELILRIGMGEIISQPNFIFIYDPSANDNFIKNILGDGLLDVSLGVALRWSSKHGIGLEGEIGFTKEISLHEKQKNKEGSFIQIPAFRISVRGGSSGASLNFGVDLNMDFGAIFASVRDIGAKIVLTEEEGNNAGLLNNLDIDFDFKMPTGVGLSIDAPPVKGGGFLNYDESTSTYTGGIELQFSKISFSAIGIISTKLPGGDPGYSLLIIVSVEFTPLQIGMGFTINGIGGLLGLHRTSNPDALRLGIRNNTLEHILFPKNIVENANTIISNLGQAFPIRKDQFMLGPMAKIGWGTPTLLTIDIGIIIELPDPVRLIILGILRAQLPNADNVILQLQVNFLGILDFKEKYLSFDATLYDSKILTFGLFGDMALRLHWGDRPNFLLSVGGFHPSYTPPPLNLPSMQRLTLILADEPQLKISVESYFAVTSNSAQFGARVYAMATAGKFSAVGELWFNVLFQFSPFYFAADMGVQFAIKMGNKTIIGIYVALMLEGPDPWRAQGQAAFKILFVKVKVRFDATFGRQRAEAIEAVKVDEKIKEALMLQDNWETQLPDQNNQMVAWRKENEGETQSVDPSGAIKISQRVMPLNTLMQKFGSAAISDFNRYEINNVTINSMPIDVEKVQDYFARSEFSNMNDEEKLSRDGYELFDSGVLVGSTDNQTSQYSVHKEAGYEEITMDSGFRRKEAVKHEITEERLTIDSVFGYATRTGLSSARLRTTSVGPDKIRLSIEGGEFVLANRKNLQQVGGGISFANSMDAERYLIQQKQLSPLTVEDWIIANRYELV